MTINQQNVVDAFVLAKRLIFLQEFLIGLILVYISYYIIRHCFEWFVGMLTNYL